jgi:hypothetical protein
VAFASSSGVESPACKYKGAIRIIYNFFFLTVTTNDGIEIKIRPYNKRI